MYTGPIIDNHMHFWDLSNDYPWLNNRDPAIERLIGNYEALRHNFLAPDYFAMTRRLECGEVGSHPGVRFSG